jgi:hypothetical protein
MVENSTAFESTSSFSLGDSISIVSHTGSDLNSANPNQGSAGDGGGGILILDGESTCRENEAMSSVLSLPGTFSLPSEIGSIEGTLEEVEDPEAKNKLTIHKHLAWLLVSIFGLTMAISIHGLNYLTKYNLEMQQDLREAKETILTMERELEETKLKSKGEWIDYSPDEAEYYTLFDNCWIKAKARWCDKKGGPSSGSSSIPLFIGEVGKAASETLQSFTEKIMEAESSASSELKEAAETMNQASDAIMKTVGAAGEAIASELQDFADKPLDYFAAAVKGVSSCSERQKAHLNGFKDTVDAFENVTNEWGEAWGEAFKRTVAQIQDLLDGDTLEKLNVATPVTEP